MEIQVIKQRFGIIGNSLGLNRAIEVAYKVSSTDLSVLITGESGTGKEVFPQIIHQYSLRKHGQYIAVNCGAIPEGTIDSELFGHEKGSFTGAHESRKGYFEVANKGTIFLDEVGELPLSTQVRLLRVIESGEFLKVGSSTVQKTNVRVIAATNVDITKAINEGRFREDLFYRLSTVPVFIPPLRERQNDILLLFRKFSIDFAEKYRMPVISLEEDAKAVLQNYEWPGNIRQLKNITEQLSIIEQTRVVNTETLRKYLPDYVGQKFPAIIGNTAQERTFASEREILYKILFDMKNDMTDLKKLVFEIINKFPHDINLAEGSTRVLQNLYKSNDPVVTESSQKFYEVKRQDTPVIEDTEEIVEESYSLQDKEIELITKSLEKYKGKRKLAAKELGISERTLYRKIKQFELD